MHFPELISTNAEDLAVLSEEMNIGKLYKHRVDKTEIDKKIIENQYSGGNLYFADGSPYFGEYHIHIDGGRVMTGAEHSSTSQNLYILKLTGELVLTGGY